jgi:hypothetical protein
MVGRSRETTTYSRVTWAGLFMLAVAIVAYLYFLNLSVVQVVMRTEQVQKQRDLNADIAMLESQYIAAQHTIASRISTLDSYDTGVSKIFVSRQLPSLVLNDN